MFAACLLLLLELVAFASTAAWYDPFDYNNGFQDKMDQFWNNFNRKMKNVDKKIENVIKRAKIRASSSQIIGDEYTITIYLTGFNKEDIVVNAKKGNLVIQAIHNVPGEPVRNYLDVRSLPDFVDEKGSWSYNNDKLKVLFPIKQHGSDDTTEPMLSYVSKEDDKASEEKDPDENVTRSDLENSYNGDTSQTIFAPSELIKTICETIDFLRVTDVFLRFSKSLAGECIEVHVSLLQWAGYMRRFCGRPCLSKAHALYRALVLAMTTAYLLQEFVYAYQERNDMTKLSRVMFLLLCHITSIVKQIVFHVDADRIDQLIHGFEEEIYNRKNENAHKLLRRTTLVARRLEQAYAGCAVLTCTLWLVFPVMSRLCGSPVHFAFWTGLNTDSPAVFLAVLLYSYYVTTLVGIANTTMDAFIATILFQCKTQLKILRMDFQNIPERARIECQKAGNNYDKTLIKLFVNCFLHYRRVTETAALFEDIFGTAILVQFGIGGWILCMAAYKLVSLNILSIEFASMALFIMCILTELFLYCYYGNELKVESDRIVCSVYSMQWVSSPQRFQRLLLLLMERARRPLRPAAGRVIPLSLDTFVKILKSSYTFYAVLRQTK